MADPSSAAAEASTRSRLQAWRVAARPQTLPAAAAPVLVGTGLAVGRGVFAAGPALVALLGAALIQVGTNFANDYYDAVKGTDEPDREGFTRATASGLLSPTTMRRATAVTFALAILSGTYLVAVGGVPILVVGLASVAAGVAYTGGPYPLGYHGLGDVFVFVFFGLIAVAGTYYVQAVARVAGQFPLAPPPGTVPPAAVLAGVPIGAIATAILVVNNVRDRESDAAAGKHTLAVRLGDRASRYQYVALLVVAYLVPLAWVAGLVGDAGASGSIAPLAPFFTLPLAAHLARRLLGGASGAALNDALESTGKLLLGFAVCFAVGLAL